MNTLSSSMEDYLKGIYEIQLEEGKPRVTTSALADKLGVARASVTGMVKKLAEWVPPLVIYERYRGVELTKPGVMIALEVVRHHRLIESYLSQALGYTWDEVDAEADRLEHVISEEFEERIARMLGHPQIDPHGAPIPGKDGTIPPRDELPLSKLDPDHEAVVSRVVDNDAELLRYLGGLGLHLGTKIIVKAQAPFGGPLHVHLPDHDVEHALGKKVMDAIFVTPRKPK